MAAWVCLCSPDLGPGALTCTPSTFWEFAENKEWCNSDRMWRQIFISFLKYFNGGGGEGARL